MTPRFTRFGSSILGTLLVLSLQISSYAQARVPGFPPGTWWKDRRIVEELRLTPEQQAKIEAVWMENRRRLIDQKAELDRRQIDLADALAKEQVDEAVATRAFEQVQAARTALERTTFVMRIRTKNVLSADQQQKLEEIAERIAERIRREREAIRTTPRPQ